MRFPVDQPKAFANSQVYGPGGDHGPKGGWQCDGVNYAYPWQDTFCESRPGNRKNRLCPNLVGHQGQDIRPNSCVRARYMAVAAADGLITQVGPFWVMLRGEDGRVYSYLHLQMDQLKVRRGDHVVRGQPIGLVSNNFGTDKKTGKPVATTIHLHFEIQEPAVQKDGAVVAQKGASLLFVPPYSSLVDSYQRLQSGAP
jgi:murein DD-endopeptidase MepM/ murein hydrolase activator NlpD